MAESTSDGPVRLNTSAGHLSVHIPGAHPEEVPFLFEQQQKRLGPAFVASLIWHGLLLTLILILAGRGGEAPAPVQPVAEDISDSIVWLAEPGPGGGGGGGGNQMPEPPRPVELPGRDRITVPVAEPPPQAPPPPQPEPEPEPEQLAQLNIPATSLAAATASLPGTIEAPPGPPSNSQGSGRGGGAGTGTGTGIGSGTGSGLGPGQGGGTGGGVYRPGSGVMTPRVLREVKPQYTSDAMRARIQGVVLLECVVQPNGVCTEIQVVRSLDPTFGLDQEAIAALRQWRFAPGTRLGEPVPVLVTVELAFTLR
jgi:TonB family protein